jgi:hypothetical protein
VPLRMICPATWFPTLVFGNACAKRSYPDTELYQPLFKIAAPGLLRHSSSTVLSFHFDILHFAFDIRHSLLMAGLTVTSYLPTQTDGSDTAARRRAAFALASPDNSSIVPARNALGGQLSTHAGSCPSRIRSRQ